MLSWNKGCGTTGFLVAISKAVKHEINPASAVINFSRVRTLDELVGPTESGHLNWPVE